jgi:heavy metal efflux system protein
LLALTLSPALCLIFFRNLKPTDDNIVVRWLKSSYIRQLEFCLNHRWGTLVVFTILAVLTVLGAKRYLGFEFMPEL